MRSIGQTGNVPELDLAQPIFDVPGFPQIDGQELTDRLIAQASHFEPVFSSATGRERSDEIR